MGVQPGGIRVSGTGEVTASPDIVSIELGISLLAPTVSEATTRAAADAEALIESLTTAGVEKADIVTTNYSISPEYDWSDNQRRHLGYRVNNTVRARVREVSGLGPLLDSVATIGDSVVVNGLQFDVDDQTALLARARELAWKDALGKAEHLSGLAGRDLGKAVSIWDAPDTQPGPFPGPRFRAMADTATATPIEGGTATVSVTLQVRFELA